MQIQISYRLKSAGFFHPVCPSLNLDTHNNISPANLFSCKKTKTSLHLLHVSWIHLHLQKQGKKTIIIKIQSSSLKNKAIFSPNTSQLFLKWNFHHPVSPQSLFSYSPYYDRTSWSFLHETWNRPVMLILAEVELVFFFFSVGIWLWFGFVLSRELII